MLSLSVRERRVTVYSARPSWGPIVCFLVVAFLRIGSAAESYGQELLTAAAKPAEGPLDVFLGEPSCDMQVVFEGGGPVREPYLAIAVDGTLLAVRNNKQQLRRSEDGGRTWGEIIGVSITHSDSNMIVDENTGDVMSERMWDGVDRVFRSRDHGKTWTEEKTTIKPGGATVMFCLNREVSPCFNRSCPWPLLSG